MGRAEDTVGPGYLSPSPLLCVTKIKKENKWKKERDSKHKLLKGCHQGQTVTVLAILERLEFKNVSYWPTIAADNIFQCFMVPPLWNQFRRPWWRYNYISMISCSILLCISRSWYSIYNSIWLWNYISYIFRSEDHVTMGNFLMPLLNEGKHPRTFNSVFSPQLQVDSDNQTFLRKKAFARQKANIMN